MRICLCFLFLINILVAGSKAFAQKNEPDSWDQAFAEVDSLTIKGTPRLALELTESLIIRARLEGNSVMLIKGAILRILFQSKLEEDNLAKSVISLKRDIQEAKQPEKSVLQSLLAETYWKFYEENRYRISQRSDLVADAGDDIRTWSLKKITNEIVKEFYASTSANELLQQVEIGSLKQVLAGNSDTRNLRPTLYDLLAHRALTILMNPQLQLTNFAENNIDLGDSVWFSNYRSFSSLTIPIDSSSFSSEALRIFQNLLKFHDAANNKDALADADLKRLSFIYRIHTGKDRVKLYLNALDSLADQATDTEIYPDVMYEQASVYNALKGDLAGAEPDYKKVVMISERLIEDYPKSNAATNAKQLLLPIKNKVVSVQIDEASLPNSPILLQISHKNCETAYFQVYRTSLSENNLYFNNELNFDAFINSHTKVLEWTVELPRYADYKIHTLADKISPLPAGNYVLIAATGADKTAAGFAVNFISFKVTALSVTNRSNIEGRQDLMVLNKLTGQAVEGVKVQNISSNVRPGKKVEVLAPIILTNKTGEASLANRPNDHQILVSHNSDSITVYSQSFYGDDFDDPRLVLFTDRPIYRPGQTLYFKGLLLQNGKLKNNIVPGETVEIVFEDVNGDEIETTELTTNEFGTVQGAFTIPTGKLNGLMHLVSDYGDIDIQVEEYKRPGFEVVFDNPDQEYRLNDSIRVHGKAISYSGYTLSGANIKYTVHRAVHRPMRSMVYVPQQQIAMGTGKTDQAGNFTVQFFSATQPGSKDNYIYVVKVDVTDISGETISSSKKINAGQNDILLVENLQSNLFLDKKSETVSFIVTNLNGEPVNAQIIAYWTLLKDPGRLPKLKPSLKEPDQYAFSEEEFLKVFPNEAYKRDDDPANWPVSRVVLQQQVKAVSGSGSLNINAQRLPPGYYRVKFKATGDNQDTISTEKIVRIYNDQPARIQSMNEWLVIKETSIPKGSSAEFRIAGALPESPVFYEVYYRERIVDRVWLTASPIQKIVNISPEPGWEDSFAVQFFMAQNGAEYIELQTISIQDPARELDVRFLSFRDKLQPGEKETWRLRIGSKTGERQIAEFAATLYDASLDNLKSMNWERRINQGYSYDMVKWRIISNYLRSSHELWFSRRNQTYQRFVSRNYEYLYRYQQGDFGYYQDAYANYLRIITAASIKGNTYSAQKRLKELAKGNRLFGLVTDKYGSVLSGVIVKSGKSSVITDNNGIYVIDAKFGDVVRFNFIGYIAEVVTVGRNLRMDVELYGDKSHLDEIIVTAYGASQKSNSTASVTIAGKASGVSIIQDNTIRDFASVEVYDKETNTYIINGRPVPGPTRVTPRVNFNETAFFYPQLRTDSKGEILIEFTIPQSLTRYKMMGFAHTKDLKTASISRTLITQKQLAISANPPRFFREGDTILLAARLNNLSGKNLKGEASLELRDALTGNIIQIFSEGNGTQKSFNISNAGNEAMIWEMVIPSGISAITYKLIAESGAYSDGEEMTIPVLPNSMLVTESLPLNVRGTMDKTFKLEKLLESAQSETLRNHGLTLEFTSNPLWYAIQALPYMMENQYECAEQIFTRFYANSFASGIINSSPEIKSVFESWQKLDKGNALLSNLEKNQDLKSILLEETPWVRAAENETERKRRLSILFDLNRMGYELKNNLDKLAQMQNSNGSFSWFPGMYEDQYITQHIVMGMGQLKKLKLIEANNLNQFNAILDKAINYLDAKFMTAHADELKQKSVSYLPVHYLYARSYSEKSKDAGLQELNDLFLKKIAANWITMDPYQQGQAALILHRSGQTTEAKKIITMLKGTAQQSEEMGMYWITNRAGWWWYQNPVETQSLLIEAFAEVASDSASVEEMKIWLLKNKHTNDWKTSKATAASCYALLLQGTNQLIFDKEPEITIAGKSLSAAGFTVTPIEAGTGYRKTSIAGVQVVPEMGNIRIKNNNNNIAWGSLYWQYFEQLDKLTPAETGIKIKKQLFLRQKTNRGDVIQAVSSELSLKPGDLLTVRIEIFTDRDMEYLHLKDMRSSGFEPVNVLSQYKYQDGFGYYESTKDASTNFFINYLRKGVYVFEYPLRVSHSGNFSNGITTLQSMYAPEFSTHSAGNRVTVKD